MKKHKKLTKGKTINIRKVNDSVFSGLPYFDQKTRLLLFNLDEADLKYFKEENKVLDKYTKDLNCLSEVITYMCRNSCFYEGVKGESRVIILDRIVALNRIEDGLSKILHDNKKFELYDISDVYEEIPFLKREINESYSWEIFIVKICIIDDKYGLCVYFGQDC